MTKSQRSAWTRRFLFAGLCASFLQTTSPAVAVARSPGSATELAQDLRSADFRIRVQAALNLGKSGDGAAIPPLLRALKDESPAVRVSAAAALKTLDDPSVLKQLVALKDKSKAVQKQLDSTIASLEGSLARMKRERQKAQVLVKLQPVQSHAERAQGSAAGLTTQASRQALRALPGVALLTPSEDPAAARRTHSRPVVVLAGSIEDMKVARSGEGVEVSAAVEFLLQTHPGYSIIGKVRGTARASAGGTADSSEAEASALGAAVESALGHSTPALLRAAQGD